MTDETLYPHELLIEWVWKVVVFLLKPFIFLMVMALTMYISSEIMTTIPKKDKPKYARYWRGN